MSYAPAQTPVTVALVLDENGSVYDEVWNVDSGIAYATAGYRVQAVAKYGTISKARAQRIYDQELSNYKDCFGIK